MPKDYFLYACKWIIHFNARKLETNAIVCQTNNRLFICVLAISYSMLFSYNKNLNKRKLSSTDGGENDYLFLPFRLRPIKKNQPEPRQGQGSG